MNRAKLSLSQKKTHLVGVLYKNKGILRLEPAWVPRAFCTPGERLNLHKKDLYSLGLFRGGIDERWLSSTVKADNGPGTPEDEGLSYVNVDSKISILLKDAIELLGDLILGEDMMKKHGGWPMYSKFFDNMNALPFHVHQMDKHANQVMKLSKPEAYFFPSQLNNHAGTRDLTFFGLNPGTSEDDIKKCLENWNKGDNGILNHSKSYTLEHDTGWYVPAGILHAPGSLLTYEPQKASDVFAMFQNLSKDGPISRDLLVKDVPKDKHDDLEYLVSMIDLEKNTDPHFKETYFRPPKPIIKPEESKYAGYMDSWIVYNIEDNFFCAKETTILPGWKVALEDHAPYGVIFIQGHGRFGGLKAETPTRIRYGQMTNDEFFVTLEGAEKGVIVENLSSNEDLVMLRHYGPGNKEVLKIKA